MPTSRARYADRAKRYLKAELKRAGIGYKELAERMTAAGLPENQTSLTARINRGTFPTWFLFAALEAIEVEEIRIR